MSTPIEWIKNKLGQIIYPVTHAKAVVMSDGLTLDENLNNIKKNVSDLSLKIDNCVTNEFLKSGSAIGNFENGVYYMNNPFSVRPTCGILMCANRNGIIMRYDFDGSDNIKLKLMAQYNDGSLLVGTTRFSYLFTKTI